MFTYTVFISCAYQWRLRPNQNIAKFNTPLMRLESKENKYKYEQTLYLGVKPLQHLCSEIFAHRGKIYKISIKINACSNFINNGMKKEFLFFSNTSKEAEQLSLSVVFNFLFLKYEVCDFDELLKKCS